MTLTFQQCETMYANDDMSLLASDESGYRFLLVKSLIRREYAHALSALLGRDMSTESVRTWARSVFDSSASVEDLKQVISAIYGIERAERFARESALTTEFYKMRSFDWGGLYQNSLEKTIVDNYVKKISDFGELNSAIESSLMDSLRGYVQCSWYNHWTSIVIEDIFKDHAIVTPAVGLIKKIDFFVDDIPFDLKVTYLPEGYIKDRRRESNLRPELTLLKQAARKQGAAIQSEIGDGALLEILWSLCADSADADSRDVVKELGRFRKQLKEESRANPTDLIRWFYENQGVRRFDASNRLFLVLTNGSNFFESWKLKRASQNLRSQVHAFLDDFDAQRSTSTLDFTWEGKTYSATACAIFIDEELH